MSVRAYQQFSYVTFSKTTIMPQVDLTIIDFDFYHLFIVTSFGNCFIAQFYIQKSHMFNYWILKALTIKF